MLVLVSEAMVHMVRYHENNKHLGNHEHRSVTGPNSEAAPGNNHGKLSGKEDFAHACRCNNRT
jgi:hypothetical protein